MSVSLPTAYQQFIATSRYARWLDKENRRETWAETVDRYLDFFFEQHEPTASKIPASIKGELREELRSAILVGDVLPSMRTLMTAGPALERDGIAGYNCFSGDTRYITEFGTRTLADTVGTQQRVLNKNGVFVDAEIREFGEQPVQRVSFKPIYSATAKSRTSLRRSFTVTKDHRWITLNRGEVTDLTLGDIVPFTSHEVRDTNTEAWIQGFGFGDGTIDSRGRAKVRLCGAKAQHLSKFEEFGHCSIIRDMPSYNGDPVVVFHKGHMVSWKNLPFDKVDSIDWLASWFAGYLAADGHLESATPGISTQDQDAADFIVKYASYAGYHVTGYAVSSVTETNYGPRSGALIKICLQPGGAFRVASIEDLEDTIPVYCAVVQDTASFTLEGGVVTGNCSYLSVDYPKAFADALFILLNGTGVGFSVERQFISKLPEIADDFHDTDTMIVVADSKLGWAQALNELISMLYQGQVPKWDVSRVRAKGERLRTFGGRASGPEPLVDLFRFCIRTFRAAAGRKLDSVEVHDIMCKVGDIVVVGGVRRCLPGNTPVFTPTGPKEIKNIRVGDTVVTGGKSARVLAAGASGVKQTLIINHRFGKLECTPEHRVAVFDSIMQYTFKPASEVVEGDRLVWDTVGYAGGATYLPKLTEVPHFNASSVTVPDTLNTDIAWLLGLFHGDGCVVERGLEIAGNMREIRFLERAASIIKSTFGLDSSVGSDGRSGVGARLRCNSAALSRWFSEHIKKPHEPIVIPDFILNATPDIRYAYAAGLLDADGRIRKDGRIDLACTVYKSYSDELVTLLAGLGIAAVVTFGSSEARRSRGGNAQDFWNISVVGTTNRKTFFEGASSNSFKLQAATFMFKGPIDFSFPIGWAETNLGYKARGNINVSAMRYDLPLLPTRVVSIEPGSSVETYDIQVEGIEQFTANGVVVHNSALISLSNPTDRRMRDAKMGQWWETAPHRALANNSACYTEKPGMDAFLEDWIALYKSKSGERGIFSRSATKKIAARNGRRDPNHEFGTNPCCFTGDTLVALAGHPAVKIRDLAAKSSGEHTFDVLCADYTSDAWAAQIGTATAQATGERPVCVVTLSDGTSFRSTDDHLLATASGDYVMVKDSAGVTLAGYTLNLGRGFLSEVPLTVESVTAAGAEEVFDLTVSDYHNFYIVTKADGDDYSGLLVHNSEIILRSQQFCNLTTNIIREDDTLETLLRKIRLSSILGTFQATVTHFRFLGKKWKQNTEEEALLGVSLTGILDNTLMSGRAGMNVLASTLNQLRDRAVAVNAEWAAIFGINPATAVTCVKPEGTTSQLTDSASGIHPRYSRYYLRTVRQDNKDPLTQMLKDAGVYSEPDYIKTDSTSVFYFPQKAPNNAILRDEMTALEQLELWRVYQEHYCEHKPSITVYVREHEWMEVGAWVYTNFDLVSGISFLPYDNGSYQQAPYQEITEEEYHTWKARTPETIDWSLLKNYETNDEAVAGIREYACVGGACELK